MFTKEQKKRNLNDVRMLYNLLHFSGRKPKQTTEKSPKD